MNLSGTLHPWLFCFLQLLLFIHKLSENVIEEIQNKLQDIRNPMAAMMVLLREMDLETESEFGGEASVAPGRQQNPVEPCSPGFPS